MTAEATPSLVEATDGPAQAGPSVRGPRARTTTAYLRYVAGKLGGAAVSLLAVLVTSFFLFRLIPGDPVKYMTGGRQVSAEQLAHYREEFGLDLPLWQQFTDYCGKALTGDLGTSYQFRAPSSTRSPKHCRTPSCSPARRSSCTPRSASSSAPARPGGAAARATVSTPAWP